MKEKLNWLFLEICQLARNCNLKVNELWKQPEKDWPIQYVIFKEEISTFKEIN